MSRIFMSYSSKDGSYASQLAQALANMKISGYLDQTDIAAGASWDRQLKEAIEHSDIFIVLLTENSVKSNYVMAEVGLAWGAGKRIVPVIPPGATMRKSAVPPILQDLEIIDASSRSLEETAAQIARAVAHAEAS